ncbi:hypothetical protein [Nocardia pseudobrasiliensis]|uniref:Secreted protein n=1 Tax=Nocardia pseudobrasiliensis TaxID=45979 RepID=A0A370I8U9_9NOCA|nr:hypothetical protein [Nocardia pseudobrasiliensis]RDI65834.1 hypothetical protein DFR76_105150 [Nocardia pseudobrasiliensis]
MVSAPALLVAWFLAAAASPADPTGAVWPHDDIYVSAGAAHAYVDVQCPSGQRHWTLTVRLAAYRPGHPAATGSATTSDVICDGVTKWHQHPIDVRPDTAPFFATHDERNVGTAELRDPDGTLVATRTRRMHFYSWD